MTTPKLWPQLVDDAKDRDISRWRLGEIAAVVREADEAWATQVEASDAELIKYIDLYIFMERDRDQCARERDVYKAERDALLRVARALRARHAAVAAFGEWQLGAEGDGDALLRALDATADEEDAALAALDAAGEGE